jgi:hypothetical protein
VPNPVVLAGVTLLSDDTFEGAESLDATDGDTGVVVAGAEVAVEVVRMPRTAVGFTVLFGVASVTTLAATATEAGDPAAAEFEKLLAYFPEEAADPAVEFELG